MAQEIEEMDELSELDSLAMQPRKKQVKAAQKLPTEFIKSVAKLFNEQFEAEKIGASFAIFGALYPDEALLCVNLSQVGRLSAVSFFASADLSKTIGAKPEQVTSLLKSMVDLVASWFAQTFAEYPGKGLEGILEAIDEMDRTWQQVSWEKRKLFVKINRNNQTLESAADRILFGEK